MKILVVEDEHELLKSIKGFFDATGCVCETAQDYRSGLEKISLYEYDAVILDLTLPDGDGLSLLKVLKQSSPATGTIILSARHALDDKIAGLELGADDYLTKPFHLPELRARINAILRRRHFQGNTRIVFREIEVDPAAKQASVHSCPLDLTKKEYDLLLFFLANQNRVLGKDTIAEHLWGDNIELSDHFDFIYTHVKNLRKKIEALGGRNYLHTIYGLGYKFSDR